jgi:hypothetical protein
VSRAGVYVIRALKPTARFKIPFLSYHFAYVGESNNIRLRLKQHFQGGGQFDAVAKPWSDREPRCVLRIPLPPWKWLLRTVETLAILAVWPVYNHKKNLWNPRRIPLNLALTQRRLRDKRMWFPHVNYVHTFALLALLIWLVTR